MSDVGFVNKMSSSWIWWQKDVSKKLEQEQQKAGKVGVAHKKQLEEDVAADQVN